MSIFASVLRAVYKLSGAKKAFARPGMVHCYCMLPYLCKTDHYLAEVMHARLIRTQTEALGGDCCDYWYVGDKSPALAAYQDLEQI